MKTIPRHSLHLTLCLLACSFIFISLQFEPWSNQIGWDRQAILSGDWWRILTGNFTHTNSAHLLMNLAGLWVIGFLFQPSWRDTVFAIVTISIVVGISIMVTDMQRYVGISGTLHGLFMYWAVKEILAGRRSSVWLALGVTAKVLWEQYAGGSSMTSDWIETRVAVEAHLLGVIAGFLLACGVQVKTRLYIPK